MKRIRDKIKEIDEARAHAIKSTIKGLCEHLRQMGLDATIESINIPWRRLGFPETGAIVGAVRVANRNVDLVELEAFGGYVDDTGSEPPKYRCDYVVQAEVAGLEDKLKAELEPVRKSFLSREIVDFGWKGKELARMLGNDASLGSMLYRLKGTVFLRLEMKPYKKHRCIRIRQKGGFYYSKDALPTAETFEAFDRIAQRIRSIAKVRPIHESSKELQ